MLLHNAAADGETEASATLLAGVGWLDLLEAVKDAVEFVAGDTAAFIDDFEEDGVGGGLGIDADRGGDGGELDCVGEKIGDDLQDAIGVAIKEECFGIGDLGYGGRFEREVDRVCVGHGSHGVDGLLGKVAKRAATNLQRRTSGLHALEVENVVDEPDEAVCVSNGDAE
jgi:hypothetical protein